VTKKGENVTNRDKNFSNFSLSEGKPLVLNSLTNFSSSMHSSTLAHMSSITLRERNQKIHADYIKTQINWVNRSYNVFLSILTSYLLHLAEGSV
jgi:hypothetical protein